MIKIGIVGFGWISENIHMPTFSKISNVEITAIFDKDFNRIKSYVEEHKLENVEVFDQYSDFLKSGVDAVIIATPNNTHSVLAIEALKSNIHVLCEKPLTLSQEEFLEVSEIEKQSKAMFVPAYVNRFRSDISDFNDTIKNSNIGKIKKVEIAWIRNKGIPRPGTWFTDKKCSGGGVLKDLGPHMIDLGLMYIADKSIKSCQLKSWYDTNQCLAYSSKWFDADREKSELIDVERAVHGLVEFKDVQMDIKLSWASDFDGDFTQIKVIGEQGNCELKTLFGLSEHRYFNQGEILINKLQLKKQTVFKMDKKLALTAFEKMANHFLSTIQSPQKSNQAFLECVHAITVMDALYDNEIISNERFESIVGMKYE